MITAIVVLNKSNQSWKSNLQLHLYCFISNPLWWCKEAEFQNCVTVQMLLNLIVWLHHCTIPDSPLCHTSFYSYLKRMGRVVHTVDPEGEAQGVAGIRTTKHSQPQSLGCLLVQQLTNQGVTPRMLQQHVAPLGFQQAVAGRALLVHWHHFLWREEGPDLVHILSH